VLFILCLGYNFWGVTVGWQSKNLPGVEFRQAQTAISAYFIQQDNDFSLAYPTPVLGKPWSIPMEFPLYQWTTVVVSNVTGYAITKAGRVVGIACFYLCLPALFLLLARWKIDPARRWLVLAVVVTGPFYIFYSRGLLIETMALMFALWFWVAFERAVEKRNLGWLLFAMFVGMGAGLVKVTTYMVYLIPPAIWAAQRLWDKRRETGWWKEFGWMAAGVVLPFAATLWWIHFADATKELNPMAHFITSAGLSDFNLGTWETRTSPAMWLSKWQTTSDDLTSPQLLWGVFVLALLVGRRRWKEIGICLGLYVLPLVWFPELYARHAYYFVANAVVLFMAISLVLVALFESNCRRWIAVAASIVVIGGQMYGYVVRYYPLQKMISPGGDALTQALRDMTHPNEYLVFVGYDWNSMPAYYARRRALMLRADVQSEPERFDPAFLNLEDEKLGALIIKGPWEPFAELIERAVARGLSPTPLCLWRDTAIFLPRDRRAENLLTMEDNYYPDLRYAPGVELPHTRLAGKWFDVAELRKSQRYRFTGMNPQPVRFFSSYGPTFYARGGKADFSAHPDTRLVFNLPAGEHVLRTLVWLVPDAYHADLTESEITDGINVSLFALGPNAERVLLVSQDIEPQLRMTDRGRVRVVMPFTLNYPGEVEFFIGPGRNGSATRDWAIMGRLTIE